MLPYATDDYVREYCAAVARAGAYEIVLFDGPSGVGPEAYGHLVRLAKESAPGVSIGVHAHNMFDLGTACSLNAAREGADVIEVSVNGYCAASGQADLAVVSAALTILYDVPTGIRHEKLTELARFGEEFTGRYVAWNHPITGLDVFNWGGMETVVQELEIDPLLHWCIEPSMFGNIKKWDITRDSGPYTMWDKLDAIGIEVRKEDVEDILRKCLSEIQQKKRILTDDEIVEIAQGVVRSNKES
jgi:isopropylmalate/homocitrate/citramalate synthase